MKRFIKKNINYFESLVNFLADELDWPINLEDFDSLDDLAFDFTPEDVKKINEKD